MTTSTSNACPCGTDKTPSECCLPIIQGKKKPQTAEALLRARYTAFTRGDVDFILSTHHSRTRGEIKREEVEDWSKNSKWMGLQLLEKQEGGEKDEKGLIAFEARYETDGKLTEHREVSVFERENGDWRFVDAHGLKAGPIRRDSPKVGRNDPCPCGSGKKNKKCCAA